MRRAMFWLVLVMAVAVAGCGWQLRGAAGGGFEGVPIAIEGAVGNRMIREVADSLRDLGAEVVPSAAEARIVLQVNDADTRRRTVATDNDGYAIEDELTYQLSFSVVPGGLAEPDAVGSARQTVRASSAFAVDDLQAADAEEEALTEDLQADAIRLMLARVGRRL